MNKNLRAQGSIEFLLILGGAVLVAVTIIVAVTSVGTNTVSPVSSNAAVALCLSNNYCDNDDADNESVIISGVTYNCFGGVSDCTAASFGAPPGCTSTCGNGLQECDEDCDEGSSTDIRLDSENDGACVIDASPGGLQCQNNTCSDGYWNASSEECDDGNGIDTDACKNDCTLSTPGASCGNGIPEGSETCDDGGQTSCNPIPGCNANCTRLDGVCGDAIPECGEACDAGAANSSSPNATCRSDCTPQRCGDTIIDDASAEQCDDGNTADGDGCSALCQTETTPQTRTADLPDSWLVLYNANDAQSIEWKDWYIAERSIPIENTFGLNVPTAEHIQQNEAQDLIYTPLQTHLNNNPALEEKIMGFVVGFRVPLSHGSPPAFPTIGGFSVDNELMDMDGFRLRENNPDNPRNSSGTALPSVRLTKAAMTPRHYMVARIDGATLGDAKNLTIRAKTIENPGRFFVPTERAYYDYSDTLFNFAPHNGYWTQFRTIIENPILDLSEVPWQAFDDDTEQTPNDAFRFGTHDVDGWSIATDSNDRLFGSPTGSRVLAFNYNSWGATTIRSTEAQSARYVPNAISAGYAAAIGATGEPYCCIGPYIDTLLGSLRNEWTLGESFYLAVNEDDWMWTVIGDPFLMIPNWFNE